MQNGHVVESIDGEAAHAFRVAVKDAVRRGVEMAAGCRRLSDKTRPGD